MTDGWGFVLNFFLGMDFFCAVYSQLFGLIPGRVGMDNRNTWIIQINIFIFNFLEMST